jgi:hypothetical protein
MSAGFFIFMPHLCAPPDRLLPDCHQLQFHRFWVYKSRVMAEPLFLFLHLAFYNWNLYRQHIKNKVKMKGIFSVALFLFSTVVMAQMKMKPDDLQFLASDEWKGELMYLDYESDQEVVIPVEMVAESQNARTYIFSYHYPTEPKADNKVQFKVNRSFTKISGNPIVSRKELPGGLVEIVTKRKAREDKKKAWMHHIYLFGPKTFSLTTAVEFMDGSPLFTRSKFSFKR